MNAASSGAPTAESILGALRARDLARADAMVQVLTVADPTNARAWSLDSEVAAARGDMERALTSATRALAQGGDLWDGIRQARALCALGRIGEAREVVGRLPPDRSSGSAQAAVGDLHVFLRSYEVAFACYDLAVKLEPLQPRHWFNRAAVRRYLGQLEEAERDYDRAIELDPKDMEARLNRSQLRTQTAERNHLSELLQIAGQGSLSWSAEVPIRYALAKEYEDTCRYEESWQQLVRGAQLRRRHLRYEVANDVATVDWIMQAYPEESISSQGCNSPAPIFIVGMPRTGSTLIERILGSHSTVSSAGELNDLAVAMVEAVRRQLGRSVIPRQEMVAASARLDYSALGRDYIERARCWTQHRARFTDKMPLNYLYCGLITRALPRAHIVHVTRHPLATCYAIFKTLFNQGYPFSYDLSELGAYYGAYHRLMQHWLKTLPGRIHEVSYEQLIADPEGEARRLCAAVGLGWEPACLDFHSSRDPVTTASAAQVRRPIYRSSLDQWRHYEAHLEPLRAQLADAGVALASL
jgi:tetratricopeptide (TPR) repeat protein